MNVLAQPYDVAAIRKDFKILGREVYGKPLVYLDNAASAQKPEAVIEAMTRLMREDYANVHRGLHYLANARDEPFWRERREATIPDSLRRRLDLFHACGRVFRENEELFAEGPELAPPAGHPADQPVPGPAGRVPKDWARTLG